MGVINPKHLVEQARTVAKPDKQGRPRETDLRRAISTTYYGLFHTLTFEMASHCVTSRKPKDKSHADIRRKISHTSLLNICNSIADPKSKSGFVDLAVLNAARKCDAVREVATVFVDMHQLREHADYIHIESMTMAGQFQQGAVLTQIARVESAIKNLKAACTKKESGAAAFCSIMVAATKPSSDVG